MLMKTSFHLKGGLLSNNQVVSVITSLYQYSLTFGVLVSCLREFLVFLCSIGLNDLFNCN